MSILDKLIAKTISTEKISEDKWSKDVTKEDKWKPPAGLFDRSAKVIAKTLKSNSDSEKQAMSRLNFYINRAGKNLSESDKKRLEEAKEELKALYGKKTVSKEDLSANAVKSLRW